MAPELTHPSEWSLLLKPCLDPNVMDAPYHHKQKHDAVNVFAGSETEMWVLLIPIKCRRGSSSLSLFSHSHIGKIKTWDCFTWSSFLFCFVCFLATPKITLTQATCLGCFHPISSDSSVVLEILKQAIQKFNKHSAEPALFKLVEIKEATRQVCVQFFSKFYQKNAHKTPDPDCFMYVFLIFKLAYNSQ